MKKVITVLALLIIFISTSVYSQYKYEAPFYIKNNTGTALTNVQVKLVTGTAAYISSGWMQTDGKDIKFSPACNTTSLLNHWVEGYLNTDTTAIWVSVPSIGANDSTLVYMFFGYAGATNTSTLGVFYGPHSSTDSVVVASSNTVSNCQRGFRFTANEDVLVAYFGKRTPNATQRYLTLFDFSTQAILAQIQVDAGSVGAYNYNALPAPLWIKSGQQYIMTLFNGSGDMYYYGSSSQIGQHLTYGDMRYLNSCTQNSFPTNILTGMHYGTPDFLYYTKQNVNPAPTYRTLPAADTLTPAVPTNLTAVGSNQTATLKWKKNTEFDMSVYSVYRNTTNNPSTATMIGTKNQPDTTYVNTGLTNGTTYYFWVKASDRYCTPKTSDFSTVASCTPTSIGEPSTEVPDKYYLEQNYPNPFNPSTTIKFGLKKDALVELKVYDVSGKEVMVLANGQYKAGNYSIEFGTENLASGVYFYSIKAGEFTEIKKMVLIK